MTILELPQGHYRDVSGMLLREAIAMFADHDAAFLAANPQCVPFHRPRWARLDVTDTATAPWGHEWYVVDDDGRLTLHSTYYDSSD